MNRPCAGAGALWVIELVPAQPPSQFRKPITVLSLGRFAPQKSGDGRAGIVKATKGLAENRVAEGGACLHHPGSDEGFKRSVGGQGLFVRGRGGPPRSHPG